MTPVPELPLMQAPYLKDVVRGYLARKTIFSNAVKEFGSPLYFLEEDVLRAQAGRFRTAMTALLPDSRFYFAMKSNNLPHVSKVLVEEGFGLDVSSGPELSAAFALGAEQVIFSGPGKTGAELSLAVSHHHRVTVLLDSFGEMERLTARARKKRCQMDVGIRVNPTPQGLWKKFGIPLNDLGAMYDGIGKSDWLRFRGLQFHSSWNLTPDRQAGFIRTLGDHLSGMPDRFLEELDFIDIGGGYWPSQGEWLVSEAPLVHHCLPAEPIETFARNLADALKTHVFSLKPCRVCFEPGRWICHEAMHLIMQVIDKKGQDLVITDAGTNAVGWERFETDYFPVINLTREGLDERPCHILGALCTPHDVWGYAYFGRGIAEGDILMIPTQGAYTYSLRQQFIKTLPRVVVSTGSGRPFCLDPS